MTEVKNEHEMQVLGERFGRLLNGGEVIELIGDVGSGKTTFVRGLARGMGVKETVQSPSFTISRIYDAARGLHLAHYDFYRLEQAGIMSDELPDTLDDGTTSVVIEWSDTVKDVLPGDRLILSITATGETSRELGMAAGGERSRRLLKELP